MKENAITVLEAEQNGVSMAMVKVCKEIRKLAKLDRIQLDESVYRSELNKHLYSYIEYCGMDIKNYIKEYLSNLQPFMIECFPSQGQDDNYICVMDHMYRVSLYIKLDKTFGNEVIVSFHENNMIQNKPNLLVPVFAEEICAKVEGSAREEIKILVQRGMLLLPIRLMGDKCENGLHIVNEQDIETPIVDQCNQYLRDLYISDLDLEALDKVELFSVLHQISFTSYGNTVFSNMSLLIDNLAMQKSTIGKKAADFALITYVEHLSIDENQVKELIELLNEKYQVRSQRGINLILERIKDGLQAKVVEQELIPDNTIEDNQVQQIHVFQ